MSAADRNKKLGDTAFNKISPFVTLQPEEIKRYNILLKKVTDEVIGKLKNDDLFKSLYRNMVFVGSFYKQTRVGKPEEFDINIVICLPNIDKAIIEKGQPGFAKIKFKKDDLSSQWTENKVLNKWLDGEYYLNNERIRRWFESTLEKCLSSLKKNPTNGFQILPSSDASDFEIKIRKGGPAFTLDVKYETVNFSVDLVPSLEFTHTPPLPVLKKMHSNGSQSISWHLVPKPVTEIEKPNQHWRYSFYTYESNMLAQKGKIKAVIRTLKKLRDMQRWSLLCSYYIETLFYHELNTTLTVEYVNNTPQTIILIHMLKKLKDALKKRQLYYFWDNTCNLFKNYSDEQTVSIVNCLEKIIKKIESKSDNIYNYFLTPEEQQKMKDSTPNSPLPTPDFTLKIKKVQESFKSSEIADLKDMIFALTEEVRTLQMTVRRLENKIDIISPSPTNGAQQLNNFSDIISNLFGTPALSVPSDMNLN